MALEFIYNQHNENTKDSKFSNFIKYVNTLNYEVFSDNGYGQFLRIDILESTYNNKQDEKRKKRSVQYISTLDMIPEKSNITYPAKINKIVSRKSISSNLYAMENINQETEKEKKEENEKSTDLCSIASVIIMGCVACVIIVSL